MNNDAFLVLANGQVFEGKSFGAAGSVTGEAVFTTGMAGYLETLTDPSYYGLIVVQTFPVICVLTSCARSAMCLRIFEARERSIPY